MLVCHFLCPACVSYPALIVMNLHAESISEEYKIYSNLCYKAFSYFF